MSQENNNPSTSSAAMNIDDGIGDDANAIIDQMFQTQEPLCLRGVRDVAAIIYHEKGCKDCIQYLKHILSLRNTDIRQFEVGASKIREEVFNAWPILEEEYDRKTKIIKGLDEDVAHLRATVREQEKEILELKAEGRRLRKEREDVQSKLAEATTAASTAIVSRRPPFTVVSGRSAIDYSDLHDQNESPSRVQSGSRDARPTRPFPTRQKGVTHTKKYSI